MHLQLILSLATKVYKIVNGLSGANFERNYTQKKRQLFSSFRKIINNSKCKHGLEKEKFA